MQADPSASAYANAATFVRTPLPMQDPAHAAAHGLSNAPSMVQATVAPAGPRVAPSRAGTAFVTGAYQLSGDAGIDRMIRLEHALKRYGRAF